MDVNENDLLNAGFSMDDVAKLNYNLALYGGTLDELLRMLSNRFTEAVWVTVVMTLIYLVTLIIGNRTHIITGGLAFSISLIIVWVPLPMAISHKAWRFRKRHSYLERRTKGQ